MDSASSQPRRPFASVPTKTTLKDALIDQYWDAEIAAWPKERLRAATRMQLLVLSGEANDPEKTHCEN